MVDRASRDETEAIAKRGADLVAIRTFDDFANQRNAALDLASGDWVFAIDADERATPELASEIRRVISDPAQTARRLPRADPERRSSAARSASRARSTTSRSGSSGAATAAGCGTVHETVDLDGTAGHAQVRRSSTGRSPTCRRSCARSTNTRRSKRSSSHREGRKFRPADLTVRPFWTFLKLYLGKLGFLDGLEGLRLLLALGPLGRRPALQAPRADRGPRRAS